MTARPGSGHRSPGYPSPPIAVRGGVRIIRSSIVPQHDPSALLISIHPQRGAVRVAPSGELDLATAAALQAQLDELRAAGFEQVVLDLRGLTFMDTNGVRLILREDRRARSAGRRFSLIAGGPAIERVLSICGLAALLQFDEPYAAPAGTRYVPAPAAERDRPRLSLAFQCYVAQLRQQGRSAGRLRRGAGRPQLH